MICAIADCQRGRSLRLAAVAFAATFACVHVGACFNLNCSKLQKRHITNSSFPNCKLHITKQTAGHVRVHGRCTVYVHVGGVCWCCFLLMLSVPMYPHTHTNTNTSPIANDHRSTVRSDLRSASSGQLQPPSQLAPLPPSQAAPPSSSSSSSSSSPPPESALSAFSNVGLIYNAAFQWHTTFVHNTSCPKMCVSVPQGASLLFWLGHAAWPAG